MLDPDGERIFVPHWHKNWLRKLGLLKRNREARLLQILPAARSLVKSGLDFASVVQPVRRDKNGEIIEAKLKSCDPTQQRTQPDKTGRVSEIVKIVGR